MGEDSGSLCPKQLFQALPGDPFYGNKDLYFLVLSKQMSSEMLPDTLATSAAQPLGDLWFRRLEPLFSEGKHRCGDIGQSRH